MYYQKQPVQVSLWMIVWIQLKIENLPTGAVIAYIFIFVWTVLKAQLFEAD